MNKMLFKFFIFNMTVVSLGIHADVTLEKRPALDAHVHGLSELTIAAEGNFFEIQLTSPAMNLVGFEHRASTSKDIATVENAALTLRQHDALFLLSGTDCEHVNTSIDLSKLIDTDDHAHAHQSESNEDEHKHEGHAQNESHSEVVANYKYRCKHVAPLSSITVSLFESFPGIQKIHAMWVKQTQQGAATLTPNNRIVVFR
ncbi:MAG: hypothetical protein ACJA04_000233 [Cellvibrionaceae bacterium]|jgi:hypothetical protein